MNKFSFISVIYYFIILLVNIVNADVSHLFHSGFGYFQPQASINNGAYGPPTTVSTTTEFFFPEVIENRKNKSPLSYYIPAGDQQPHPIPAEPPNQAYIPVRNYQKSDSNFVVVYDQNHNGGYEYNEPTTQTPPAVEEPPLLIPPALLPPIGDVPAEGPPNLSPGQVPEEEGYDYNPPSQTYLPSNSVRNSKDFFDQFTTTAKNPLRVRVNEMRCLSNQGGFFRALLKIDGYLGTIPIIENDSYSLDSSCALKLSSSTVTIDLAADNFQKCGVRNCGLNLCLKLRFPSIRGMKTVSDSLLTLQCKTQTRIVAKTHAIKMGVSNEVQGRSLGAYAQGGSQQPFRTHIEILKRTGNGFTKHLEQNGIVQLGEELLLRAHVIAGDGWNYTKLTDVYLQRQSLSGDILNSANLITSNGCTNPTMRTICPLSPIFDPPLGHRLSFKAVMFDGMKSGDQILMTMKISGCLEHHDCHINTQHCNDLSFHGRDKRSLDNLINKNGTEFSEISRIAFRVASPSNNQEYLDRNELRRSRFIICGAIGFVGSLIAIGLVAFWKLRK